MTYRRTKIVATWGPAIADEETARAVIRAGVNVVRLNFSHATTSEMEQAIPMLRRIAEEEGRTIALLQDIQGPRLRTGAAPDDGVALASGEAIVVSTEAAASAPGRIAIAYPGLADDLRPGHRILIADGAIVLRVNGVRGTELDATVEQGGIVTAQKGVNLPDSFVSIGALMDKDREDLTFGVQHQVDFVALSFVRRREDVLECRRIIRSLGASSPIIAKVEHPEAVANIEGILSASDGIMVARGDLGVEVSPERVPLLQKEMIRRAGEWGVPVITATQMLESMVEWPVPTRAEASDVANAILDGSDAIMLSAETAIGAHPLQTIQTMHRIALQAETTEPRRFGYPTKEQGHVLAAHARVLAEEVEADAMLVFTRSGHVASLLSHQRPSLPIYAMTTEPSVARRLALPYGVTPIHVRPEDEMETIGASLGTLRRRGYAEPGQRIVVLSSSHGQFEGLTDLITVQTVPAEA